MAGYNIKLLWSGWVCFSLITQPLLAPFAHADPNGAAIIAGDITISGAGTGQMTITQSGDKGLIEWQSFSINSDEHVHFAQPSSSSITANRVVGSDPSQILGQLSATGQLLLINPNGVVFGRDAQIDTASFIATTHQMDEASFLGDSGILRFDQLGSGATSIINHGYLRAGDGGTIALLAPQIENHGTVRAHLGQVALVASKGVSLDLYGDGLISFDVSDSLDESLVSGDAVLISQAGTLEADGGHILMTAKAASDLITASVNISGIQQARTLSQSNGRISLRADAGVLIEESARFEATSAPASGLEGGVIDVEGRSLSQGGVIDGSGDTQGGTIVLTSAGQTALSGTQLARGHAGDGGDITIQAGNILENEASRSDVSGEGRGGRLSVTAKTSFTSSGQYQANGAFGGQIDVTAADMRLFSAEFEAAGSQDGGLVRLGGAFQGGKILPATTDQRYRFDGRWPEAGSLENAATLFVNDTTRIDVSAQNGAGGTAILWSDDQTTFLGAIEAGGVEGGAQGGAVEISSANLLRRAKLDKVNVGDGYLLLDPQNILIGSATEIQSWAYSAMLGVQNSKGGRVTSLARDDEFGRDVALDSDNNRMAVGTPADDGNSGPADSGAVYLYRFSDSNFSGATLAGTIGHGYTGGNNVNVTLGSDDRFGYAVALDGDGDRLAVSAPRDDGSASGSNLGAVYLFTFDDTDFTNGQMVGRIGSGYTGSKSLNMSGTLSDGNNFGYGLAINDAGTRLAAGAPAHSSGGASNSGAVYLFSFSDGDFTSPSQDVLIAKSAADLNISELTSSDIFGASVDFDSDGDRLAIGAPWSQGDGSGSETGAVFLVSFTDTSYGNPSLAMKIGSDYKTGNDIDEPLTAYDWFGTDVALNGDGTRLAVGVPRDDGLNGNDSQAGAVYLYSLNAGFAGGSRTARIGADYNGEKDINMPFDNSYQYQFGESVALNDSGDRLLVGAHESNGLENDSNLNDTGAIYMFRFSDTSFSRGELVGIMGADYDATTSGDNENWNSGDEAGTSIALNSDATLLAVGAPTDKGSNNADDPSGAVFLYSFTNSDYAGATLQSIIGKGYTGGKNYNLSSLAEDDRFGESVALNGSGDRLAVGAALDDGSSGPTDSGAVYLFSFTDTSFSGASLSATIGAGYSGGNNLSVSGLGATDMFGASVALSDDANLLAIGAPGDDGDKDDFSNIGAVHLVRFQNSNFSSGAHIATIGRDYSDANDIAISGLGNNDEFGKSVALDADGDKLVVGAPFDDAGDDKNTDTGAIYLLQFGSTDFTSGALYATLGLSYGAGQDVNMPLLDDNDQFGISVALDGDGDRLAVGAHLDDGQDNAAGNADSGAVYLFSFSDNQYSNAVLRNIIGRNHSGGTDLALSQLESGDMFGRALAYNETGDRLAVGTSQSDGWYRNMHSQSGAVYLFNAAHSSGGYTHDDANGYSELASDDVTINAYEIADQLGRGTDVTLQASNDIKMTSAIQVSANNSAGDLTLQAGRSVEIAANITTDGGDITLIANDHLSNGVVDNERLTGDGVITMSDSTSFNAGAGAVSLELRSGSGKTYSANGDITLNNITAGRISIVQAGASSGHGTNLLATGRLTATESGNAITISSPYFINNSTSASALNPSHASGRYLLWTNDEDSNQLRNVSPQFLQYNASYGSTSVQGNSGDNGLLMRLAPTITAALTSGPSKIYDGGTSASLSASDLTLSGGRTGDSVTASLGSGQFADANVGSNKQVTASSIALTGASRGAVPVYGYQLASSSATGNVGTITAKSITLSAPTANNKTYDQSTSATLSNQGSFTGLIDGDDVSLTGGSASFADANVGDGKTVTFSGYSLSGDEAANYTLATSSTTTTANISAVSLSLSAPTASNKTYDQSASATLTDQGSLSGILSGDDVSLTGGSASFADANVGDGKTVTFSGYSLSGDEAANYTLATSSTTTTANISAVSLSLSAPTASNKTYDQSVSATLTNQGALSGILSGDDVSLTGGSASFADANVGNGKTVTFSGYSLSGDEAANYTLATASTTTTANISAASLSLSAPTASNKTYDQSVSATLTNQGALSGILSGDDVSLTGGSASFADANVGNGKTVTFSGYSLSGDEAANYTLATASTTTTANISAVSLSLSAPTASNKTYDQSASATLTDQGSLSGILSGDDVSLTGGSASFADANVGNGKTVTFSGYSLSGDEAANYTLATSSTTTTANISAVSLSLSAPTASNKTYDQSASATLTDQGSLSGILSGDDVSLTGGSASFADANVGDGKTVTFSGYSLSGDEAANYTLATASTTTTADISAKTLTISAPSISDKSYDGNQNASVSAGSLSGLVGNEQLGVSATGQFGDSNAGTSKYVSVSYSLSNGANGGRAANYTLADGSGSADITPKSLSISGSSAASKDYDGTLNASVSAGTLAGLVGAQSLTVSASGSFADKNVGQNKQVTASYSLGDGANNGLASNYQLASEQLSADINVKSLSISAPTIADKIYDGTQSASATPGSLSGLVGGESLTVSASGSFDDINVGNGKSVSVSYELGDGANGGLASNYSLNSGSGSASISARTLTLPNLSIADKIYDGDNAASIASFGSFGNLISGDDVELDSSAATASFANANANITAGTTQTVSVSGLSLIGGDSANYQLGSVTGAASITPKSLVISGSSVASKRYDGTRTADIEAGTLSGFIGNESLGLQASGLFNSAQPGKNKPVVVSYQLIDGLNNGLALNYKLDDDTLFADIEGASKKSEDLRFTRLMDKEIIEVKEEMGSAYQVMVEKLETELVELADASLDSGAPLLNVPQEGIVDAMGSWSMLSCDISQGMAGYCGVE